MIRLRDKKSALGKRVLAFLLCSSLLVSPFGTGSVRATETGETTETTETSQNGNNTDSNGKLGKNTDVGIEVAKSITSGAGKKTKISFKLKSLDTQNIKLKNVYPVIDSAFPFETSGDAYKVVKAGSKEEKQAVLSASFSMTARSDISDGYHSVDFMVEYTKVEEDGTTANYYVTKTINVYFEEETDKNDNSNNDSDDDVDDDSDYSGGSSSSGRDQEDEEVTAPKLILTGMETEPERIMAGDTFKLKIHIQNTSKTTPVCNGKFLIGNEVGNFLPTSGSSAVFVEKIPAGETGDLEIEMKTSADLPQKNYILVVKGDFDDGKGNNFTSSDNLSLTVYQEVKLGVSDISMSPEILGIDREGSLMFTINNQGSAGVYNVKVTVKDDAVTGEESYVGNIAASSSAYATLNVTGVKENIDSGTITVEISYEDSEGNAGKLEQKVTCTVSANADDYDEYDEYDDEDFEDYENSSLPWWAYVLIALVVVAAIVVIIVILVKRKKKRKEALLAEDDDWEDDLDEEADEDPDEDQYGDSEEIPDDVSEMEADEDSQDDSDMEEPI
ncbi:MAG: hypothetical protein IJ801_08800 [Lachnospiraceae bacterium]|nr:hypothetical protein [Lachnospiraceae bacterium]